MLIGWEILLSRAVKLFRGNLRKESNLDNITAHRDSIALWSTQNQNPRHLRHVWVWAYILRKGNASFRSIPDGKRFKLKLCSITSSTYSAGAELLNASGLKLVLFLIPEFSGSMEMKSRPYAV